MWPSAEIEVFDSEHKASFTDLELYWNVILGLFMTGANGGGIKLMYQSIRDAAGYGGAEAPEPPGRDGLSGSTRSIRTSS